MVNSKSVQSGVGLIEVLITVLLLSTALLALSGLQLRSLQYNSSAYVRSQANIYAYDIIDRIRISKLTPSQYNISFDASIPVAVDLPSRDLNEWLTNLSTAIAGAKGQVACDATRICVISIKWKEQNALGNTGNNGIFNSLDQDDSSFIYTVRI